MADMQKGKYVYDWGSKDAGMPVKWHKEPINSEFLQIKDREMKTQSRVEGLGNPTT